MRLMGHRKAMTRELREAVESRPDLFVGEVKSDDAQKVAAQRIKRIRATLAAKRAEERPPDEAKSLEQLKSLAKHTNRDFSGQDVELKLGYLHRHEPPWRSVSKACLTDGLPAHLPPAREARQVDLVARDGSVMRLEMT